MIKKSTSNPSSPATQSSPADAPATSKAAITRERILTAALGLFREKGFDNTTMRDIATSADMATGAAYYYFRSKEELVLAFYEQTDQRMSADVAERLSRAKTLRTRIQAIPELWLEHFSPHRNFLIALFRIAVNPANPLSPFAAETRHTRHNAISWFEQAINQSSTTIPKEYKSILPRLLWLYQMGIIFYWLYDRSPNQQRTRKLLAGSIELITMMIQLSSLPLLGKVRRKIATVADDAGIQSL